MPHFDAQGREEWVCQKGAHVCTGESTWVDRGSPLGQILRCHGNVCHACRDKPIVVEVGCRVCDEKHLISVWPPGYAAWQMGALIQNALPSMSVVDRELLISQTCSKCFDKMFAEET